MCVDVGRANLDGQSGVDLDSSRATIESILKVFGHLIGFGARNRDRLLRLLFAALLVLFPSSSAS